MLRSSLRLIRSRAGRIAARRFSGMALLETLVAAAILGAAALAFLFVLQDARADLARARKQTAAVALATTLLAEAREGWMSGPRSGTQSGFSWSRRCATARETSSQRLILVRCSVAVEAGSDHQAPSLSLESAFAAPRPDFIRP